jgi:hypothetical protein
MKWLWILILCAGCKKQSEAPSGPPGSPARDLPVLPANEVKRGQDACKAYVDKVCACAEAMPAFKEACSHARALPEAMQVELEVAANADSARRDVLQLNDSVRKIVKGCIEETAKLPAAGCP